MMWYYECTIMQKEGSDQGNSLRRWSPCTGRDLISYSNKFPWMDDRSEYGRLVRLGELADTNTLIEY